MNLAAVLAFPLYGMRVQRNLFWAGIAICGLAAASMSPLSRTELVQQMDDYYQKQFADLRMTEQGIFGASRVESSKIKRHARDGGDPGYRAKEWSNSVSIWGNRGKPLDPATLERRYRRHQNIAPKVAKDVSAVANAQDFGVSEAAKQFRKGDFKPYVWKSGEATAEARPIRLSKPECVGCHKGMKKGEAVAVIVYFTAPAKA